MSDGTASEPIPPAQILVIDDEEIVHASLRKILGRQGHHVETVLSAAAGLDKMYGQRYDLVITDLMMPEMNGIELLERMKKERVRMPVVMITGYPTISTAVKALRLGAVDYLAKPFTRQELLAPVNRALRRGAGDGGTPPDASATIEIATTAEPEEGIQAPQVQLTPGDTYYLREHSWATFRQDGSMDLGVEASFLGSIGPVVDLEIPRDGDLVEQGYVGFKLTTDGGEVHSVFMPLSGQVVEVHTALLGEPRALTAESWIVRVIPTRLDDELALLKPRR